MKVYFVSRGKVEDFDKQVAKDSEIIVFGFGAIAELNYKKECEKLAQQKQDLISSYRENAEQKAKEVQAELYQMNE